MQQAGDQRLYRGKERIVGGVCSGLAEGFRVDPVWMRLGFVVLALLQGVGVLLYLVLWLVMPERVEGRPAGRNSLESLGADLRRMWSEVQHVFGVPTPVPPAQPPPAAGLATHPTPPSAPSSTTSPMPPTAPQAAWLRQSWLPGLILIAIGLAFLGSNLGLIRWAVIWPAALIAVGIALLARSIEKQR